MDPLRKTHKSLEPEPGTTSTPTSNTIEGKEKANDNLLKSDIPGNHDTNQPGQRPTFAPNISQ
jgi:hypothetical protein